MDSRSLPRDDQRSGEGQMTEDEIAFLSRTDPAVVGLFFTMATVLGALHRQGAFDREKLIDFLLEGLAGLPPAERKEPAGMFRSVLIEFLEKTQFPPPDKP